MKPHIKALRLVGMIILVAAESGCDSLHRSLVTDHPHRLVTISSATSTSSNPCEVDFPVTLLRKSKNHTIAWFAADHDYWIKFDPVNGTPSPISLPVIKISKGSQTTDYPISISPTSEIYFMYSVYDVDPTTTPPPAPCKLDTDDHDTGLNVKP